MSRRHASPRLSLSHRSGRNSCSGLLRRRSRSRGAPSRSPGRYRCRRRLRSPRRPLSRSNRSHVWSARNCAQEPRVQPQARPAPRPEQPPVQRAEPRVEPRRDVPVAAPQARPEIAPPVAARHTQDRASYRAAAGAASGAAHPAADSAASDGGPHATDRSPGGASRAAAAGATGRDSQGAATPGAAPAGSARATPATASESGGTSGSTHRTRSWTTGGRNHGPTSPERSRASSRNPRCVPSRARNSRSAPWRRRSRARSRVSNRRGKRQLSSAPSQPKAEVTPAPRAEPAIQPRPTAAPVQPVQRPQAAVAPPTAEPAPVEAAPGPPRPVTAPVSAAPPAPPLRPSVPKERRNSDADAISRFALDIQSRVGRLVKDRGDAAYPRLARDRRWEGTSHVRVEFMPGGKVKSIVVQHQQRLRGAGPARASRWCKEVMPKVPDELRDRRILRALPDRVQAGGKALANSASMEDLYPPIEPAQTGWLEAGGGHRLYFEVCGNRQGAPVLFLHGGPGSSTNPGHRRFFDPCVLSHRPVRSARLRALDAERGDPRQYHCRSAGRHRAPAPASRAWNAGCCSAGRGAARWRWPMRRLIRERVRGLVLRGVFLATDGEVAWYLEGLRHFLPEAWEALARGVPQASCAGLIAHYHAAVAPRGHVCGATLERVRERDDGGGRSGIELGRSAKRRVCSRACACSCTISRRAASWSRAS